MTHVTCRLTAKNRDQLRNPTLGNRVWATFTFYYTIRCDTRRYFNVRSKADMSHMRVARLSCSQTACDWMTGRKRSHSDFIQLTAKWGAGGDNVASRQYYYGTNN